MNPDELLQPRQAPDSDLVNRALLREQTSQLLEARARRRRLLRRGAQSLGVAVVFALGVVSRPWLIASPEAVPVVKIEYVTVIAEAKVEPPAPVEPPPRRRTPYQLEIQAELSDDPAEVAQCYRLAGDGYLEATNLPAAARCYRSALEATGPAGWQLQPDDTWLMVSMKNAQPHGETDR